MTLGLDDLLPWGEVMKLTAQVPSRPGNPPGQVHFWAEAGGNYGLYQNPHNDYLASFPAPPGAEGEVVVMRFMPPHVPQTRDGRTAFTGSEQVRYWSMCIGGVSTQTNACVADFEAKLDAAGYVTLVVSDAPEVRSHATGMNLLSWGGHRIPVLIYRNLVTKRTEGDAFAGDLRRVPPPEPGKDPMDFVAERFIGPYAPAGVQCTKTAFLENYCGFGVRASP
jgi:hypothetical protein